MADSKDDSCKYSNSLYLLFDCDK